ncbi:MAG: hypothetical protein WAV73_00245 [Candidatus Moraniibacteriota bacterium]
MTATPSEEISGVDLENPTILGVLGNTRTYYQYIKMRKDLTEGYCPFCRPKTWRYPEILRVGNWIAKPNDMPYINSEYHFVFIYVKHVVDQDSLSDKDWADLHKACRLIAKKYNIDGYGFVMRCGNIARTAGSITHIHAHMQVVRLDDDGFPVGQLVAYFAKSREVIEWCQKMVALFERVRIGNLTGVRKGFIVFDSNGVYLNRSQRWESRFSRPNEADLLAISMPEIVRLSSGRKNPRYWEALTSNETGIVIADGPFEIK